MKMKNLKGMKFSRWQVIEFNEVINQIPIWICLCECGTLKNVSGKNLKNGSSKSCGCLRKEFGESKKANLTGLRFHSLEVIEESGRDKSGNVKWMCKCDCNEITIVSSPKLKNGTTKSCGCYNRKRIIEEGIKYSRSIEGRSASRIRLIGKRGADTNNWKGGKEQENIKQRYSPELREWRELVYKRDGFICQICLCEGKRLNAHHIKPWAHYKDLRFDVRNGITLCVDCHKNEHKVYGNPKIKRLI